MVKISSSVRNGKGGCRLGHYRVCKNGMIWEDNYNDAQMMIMKYGHNIKKCESV